MPVNEPAGERDHYHGGGCAPFPLLSQSPRLLGADPINIAPARLSRARFGLFSRITSTGSCPCMKAATEVPTDRFGGKWKKRSSNSSSVVQAARCYEDPNLGIMLFKCCSCKISLAVPFSCKTRICPSCIARKAETTAIHVLERLPQVSPSRRRYRFGPAT